MKRSKTREEKRAAKRAAKEAGMHREGDQSKCGHRSADERAPWPAGFVFDLEPGEIPIVEEASDAD